MIRSIPTANPPIPLVLCWVPTIPTATPPSMTLWSVWPRILSLRYPLVDGQGNFGSVDGDPPAAYRYTEARMSKMACEMLTDIDKDTIDWDPNFDETKKEPHVLPSRFPNLLCQRQPWASRSAWLPISRPTTCARSVNAVWSPSSMTPEIDLAGLMEYVKGPDFPTGGIIMGRCWHPCRLCHRPRKNHAARPCRNHRK